MFLEWTDSELKEAGLDKQKVLSIARRLEKLSKEMREIGLSVYGDGAAHGYLVHCSRPTEADAIIADIGYGFTGGDW
jgi:hypothetical protein